MKDTIKIHGEVRLQVKDSSGNTLKDTGFMRNTIVNGALAVFSGLVGNTGAQTAFTFLALGTDATAASASQTALLAELATLGLARVAATITRSTTTQTNDTLQLDYTWTASGGTTINEIGVFNAISSGVMAARKVTGAITVANTNLVVATYKITFS